jgi:hypothetical protein
MFGEPGDPVCAIAEMDNIEKDKETNSQNEKHFRGLRDRVGHSFILASSLPESNLSYNSAGSNYIRQSKSPWQQLQDRLLPLLRLKNRGL